MVENQLLFFVQKWRWFAIVFLFLLFPAISHAAALTWDGGGADNNWSTCANWSTDVCPTSADTVTFNTTSTKDATIDASFGGTVAGMTISSGYTGTITQSRTFTINGNYSQAAGTFTGGSQTIDLNGSFSLTGGIFTSTSGNFAISSNFTVTGSPTFNANNGTTTFDGTNNALACGNVTFNMVSISKGVVSVTTIGSDCTLPLGNSPSSGGLITNNGTITAGTGTWTITGSLNNAGTITSSLTKIDINTSTGAAGDFTSSGGTITMAAAHQLDVENNFTYTAGTVPNFNLTINGIWGASMTCGSLTFDSVTLAKSANSTFTINSSCTIPSLGDNPTTSGIITNNGTITAGTGTWTISGGMTNNGTITTNLSRIDINAGTGSAGAYVANTGSTLTMSSPARLDVDTDYTYNGGTVPSLDLVMAGGWSGTVTCGSGTLNSFAVSKTNGGNIVTIHSSCNLPSLGNSPTTSGSIVNNGTMTVGTGTWTSNGGITNNGTINTSLSLLDVNWNSGTDYFTSNAGGTLTMSSAVMTIGTGFVYNGGTLPSSINLTMDGIGGTLTCGSYVLGNLTISSTNSSFGVTPGSDCTVSGNLSFTSGNIYNPASAKTWSVQGNVSVTGGSTFGGSNFTLEMSGGSDKTISSTLTFSGIFKVNKTSATSTLASNLTLGSTMLVAGGTFSQGASYNLTTGGAVTVSSGATWSNTGTGDITLAGNVSNSGTITLDGSGSGCGNADAIAIASSVGGAQRTWSGAGTFNIYDTTVSDMTGSVTTYSSSNVSNNGWTFISSCYLWSQSTYRWFDNANSATPGSALASEGSVATTSSSSMLRLRMNATLSGLSLSSSLSKMKLQVSTSTSAWVDVGSSWWNSSWRNRRQITFDNATSTENLIDFPVLVALSSSNIDYSKTQNSGQDIRFVDSDGTTLSYQIEKWDESGTSYVWVKVPQIDAGSTTDYIWMYYNNPSASDGQNTTSVWNSSYLLVHHLPDGTTLSATDSTINSNNGTITGPTATTSIVDGGANFAGGTNRIDSGNISSANFGTGPFSISLWVKNNSSVQMHLISKRSSCAHGSFWNITQQASGAVSLEIDQDGSGTNYNLLASNTTINNNNFHLISVTRSGTTARIYIDGAIDNTGTTAGTTNISNSASVLEGQGVCTNNYSGIMDEVRISTTARSASWINAEYKTMAQLMNTYSAEETYGITMSFYNNAGVTDGATLSATSLGTSNVSESYVEANPTALNPNSVTVGQLAEWDFSLDPSGLSDLTTYFFRMVNGDGTAFSSYSSYAVLGIQNNTTPSSAASFGPTSFTGGDWTNDNTPTLTFALSDPDIADTVSYRIQIDDTSDFSSPVVDYTSALGAQGSTSFTVGQVTSGGTYTVGNAGQSLADGSYYWRVKTIDSSSAESAYVVANSGAVAFKVDATEPSVSDISASDIGISSVTVSVSTATDGGSGISSYLFENLTRSTSGAVGSTTSWTESGLSAHTTYLYKVTVTDIAGNIATKTLSVTTGYPAGNGQPDIIGKVNDQGTAGFVNPNANYFSKKLPLPPASVTATSTVQWNKSVVAGEDSYHFTRSLHLGQIGEDVKELQQYLNSHGFVISDSGPGSPGNETEKFGTLTFKALIRFQEAHAKDILLPSGLKKGTGFFGASTRLFVNSQ